MRHLLVEDIVLFDFEEQGNLDHFGKLPADKSMFIVVALIRALLPTKLTNEFFNQFAFCKV